MKRDDMLAGLLAQAAVEGSELVTLRAIVEEASELGAERVLTRLGLADEGAPEDLGELRELLGAWRAAKTSAWKAAVAWTVRAVFALLLIGIAVLCDALLHPACEGEAAEPPASPSEGETWLVASGAGSEWAGADGKLAARQAGNWLFVAPRDGMRLFDRATGQVLLFRNGWQRPSRRHCRAAERAPTPRRERPSPS